jgi:hypothetical protein
MYFPSLQFPKLSGRTLKVFVMNLFYIKNRSAFLVWAWLFWLALFNDVALAFGETFLKRQLYFQ